ncbi:MAG: hypothetical protein JWQ87_5235 [Candidatus Sulfotelmatobacter sp.]|nr:hypothetical protein [Candidatus Sulfotelmatobacter sp.]
MYTVQEFVKRAVAPAIQGVMTAQERQFLPEQRRAQAAVFESFLWLHLGNEVGALPSKAVAETYENYYKDFFRNLNARKDPTLEQEQDLFRSKLYVNDTAQSRELKATFPNFVILIEKAMRGEDVFTAQRNRFRDPEALRPIFKNFLRLATTLASDPLLQEFTSLFQFADPREWAKQWGSGECTAEQVALAEDEPDKVPRAAVVYVGYLRLWSYTHQLRQMAELYEQDRSISSDDRFKLIDRAKEILGWRINLTSLEASKRFEQVASSLKAKLDQQAEEQPDLQAAVDELKRSFDTVFQFWFSFATVTA